MIRPVLTVLTAVLAATLVAPPETQGKKNLPKNDPKNCPWCHGDPELMKAAGVVSHGKFQFATTDTTEVDAFFGGKDIYWIETAHFDLGLCLGPMKVTTEESKKVRAELAELSEVLPDVDSRARVLGPFERTHLYALRVEKLWKRFLEVMQVKDSDFPDGRLLWRIGTPYRGEGPYLGQKGKYELLVLPTAFDQVGFLQKQFGLTIKRTQRWNVIDRDTLIVVSNLDDNDLHEDAQIHGHVVFNLTINMLDGFKHYSYETPVWLREGLGHFMEREVNPRFNSFDASEGSDGVLVNKEDWDTEVKQLITAQKAPRLAELSALRTYAEFELRHHYVAWSMTTYLIEVHAKGYACLSAKLHGRKRPDGSPDGEDMQGVQRNAFVDCLGMTYPQFDLAWQEWALRR